MDIVCIQMRTSENDMNRFKREMAKYKCIGVCILLGYGFHDYQTIFFFHFIFRFLCILMNSE